MFNPTTQLADSATALNPPKTVDLLEPIRDRMRLPIQSVTPTSYQRGMQLLELQDRFPNINPLSSRRGSFMMGGSSGYNPFG
jgi:hypothetical protein